MATARLEVLLHPVRLRLVHAMHAAGVLTTSELCAALPDVPKATLYRQVGRLVRARVFEVESERQVRGAVERRYQLAAGGAAVGEEDAKAMTRDDHRRGFAAAIAALLGEFHAYLNRRNADPMADEVSYRQFIIWLRPSERSKLIQDFWRVFRSPLSNEPGAGRKPHILSTIFFPASPKRPNTPRRRAK